MLLVILGGIGVEVLVCVLGILMFVRVVGFVLVCVVPVLLICGFDLLRLVDSCFALFS